MAQQRVKWGQVERYFRRHGYDIVSRGGDKIIKAPPGQLGTTRNTVLIGHEFSDHAGDELSDAHLSKIRRAFGVTRDDILNE